MLIDVDFFLMVWMKMIANLPLLAVFTSQVILTDRHNQALLDHKINFGTKYALKNTFTKYTLVKYTLEKYALKTFKI